MDILISDKPYDLLWKKRGSKYLTQTEVDNLHNALIEDSKNQNQQEIPVKPIEPVVPEIDYISIPLYFEAIHDNTQITFINNRTITNVQYSFDNVAWHTLANNYINNNIEQISLSIGNKLYFRCVVSETINGQTSGDGHGIGRFSTSHEVNIGGNILSMIFGNDFVSRQTINREGYNGYVGVFYRLFTQTKIVDASKLKLVALELSERCYEEMFKHCSSLITAPELPATTLADYCYYGMFSECESLVCVPELPATTLTKECYSWMFANCSNLTTPMKILPSTELVEKCYSNMFNNCVSLISTPILPRIINLVDSQASPNNTMFRKCKSLKTIIAFDSIFLQKYEEIPTKGELILDESILQNEEQNIIVSALYESPYKNWTKTYVNNEQYINNVLYVPVIFGAPAAEDTTPDITDEDVNKDQTTFTGLPFLIGTEEEESVGTSIPYLCSEDLVFIIASESGNGYL